MQDKTIHVTVWQYCEKKILIPQWSKPWYAKTIFKQIFLYNFYVVTISARGFILWHLCQVIYYIFHLSAHVKIILDSEYCYDIGIVSNQ